MRWTGHGAYNGEIINAYKILGREEPGRPRHIWEKSIKMDLGKTRGEYVSWIELALNRA
jgi:hypothetical protein